MVKRDGPGSSVVHRSGSSAPPRRRGGRPPSGGPGAGVCPPASGGRPGDRPSRQRPGSPEDAGAP